MTKEKIKWLNLNLNNQEDHSQGVDSFLVDPKFGLPIKKALFTCNHIILNEELIMNHDYIDFKFKNENRIINIQKDFEIFTLNSHKTNKNNNKKVRKIFTESSFFDYTCIEILEEEFQDIETFKLSKNWNKNNQKENTKDIYILHFPLGGDLSFSFGQVKK